MSDETMDSAAEPETSASEEQEKVDSTDESAVENNGEPGLIGMILRDLAVVFAAVSLWAAADTWYQVTGLWLAQVIAIGDAILVGLLLASLFHEWGHYAGSVASGAKTTRVLPQGLSFFRFNFEYEHNDHRQFHWMTYGGHIFHWFILIVLLIALPLDSLGRIALVSAVFGFIVFATFIEYNIVKDTWAGADPKARLDELTEKDIQKSAFIGGLSGLFAIAALS